MKKSLIAFLCFIAGILLVVSCSADDSPKVNFHLTYLATEGVSVPDHMERGETYTISVYYKKPDDCHYFNGMYSTVNQSVYTMAVEAMVLDNVDCQPSAATALDVASFNFTVPLSVYNNCTFKFYTGTDAQGNDTFIVKEVPVWQ